MIAKNFFLKKILKHRVINLLLYPKHFINNSQEPFEYCVELSWQKFLTSTGLRVETLIYVKN